MAFVSLVTRFSLGRPGRFVSIGEERHDIGPWIFGLDRRSFCCMQLFLHHVYQKLNRKLEMRHEAKAKRGFVSYRQIESQWDLITVGSNFFFFFF